MPARLIRSSTFVSAALASLAVAAAALPPAASADDRTARVVKVLDGDSVVLTAPGGPRRYDLLGVRAPRIDDCFGREARARLRALLPPGSRARVVAPRPGARRVVVLRRGAPVSRLVVRSGHARATLRDGSRLARALQTAQQRAQEAARGIWSACENVAPAEQERPVPNGPGAPVEAPAAPAPPARPVEATGLSRAQFEAFVENSVFTRVRASSDFGGSSSRSDFTFCPGDLYRLELESFNNGLVSGVTEAGRWQLVELTRVEDLGADQGTLQLVTEESNDPDFDPSAPESQRAFTVVLTVFDDGRVAVGDDFAQRSVASC